MLGDRLSDALPLEDLKLAAGLLLLAPFLPMLFMGEEYAETAPFPYFVSHTDAALVAAVRRGRKEEFASFSWNAEPPDPQAESTFLSAKLRRALRHTDRHKTLWEFYSTLIRLRKTLPGLAEPAKERQEAGHSDERQTVFFRRWSRRGEACATFHFARETACAMQVPAGRWTKQLYSAEPAWGGEAAVLPAGVVSDGGLALELAPRAFALYSRIPDTER
jgi:maltooligosyltrehalose trehalohydrolase